MTNDMHESARLGAKKPGPKPSVATVDALCNECGDVRTAKAAYLALGSGHRPLRCDACGRATEHYRAPTEFESDWRESRSKKSATLLAQLQASLAMLDQLGIRFDYVDTDEWAVGVWRERGRGSEAAGISLAADLTVGEQVDYVGRAWRYQLPAAEARWLDAWYEHEEDPEMEWRSLSWKRDRGDS
jgi:hypothetical protein